MSEHARVLGHVPDIDGAPVTVGVRYGLVTINGQALPPHALEDFDRLRVLADAEAAAWRREHWHEDPACPHGPGGHERRVGCEDGEALCRHCARDLRGEQHQIGCPGWDEDGDG